MDNFNTLWNSFIKIADGEEAAEGDYINPHPELWDMRADGALVSKPIGRNKGGGVVVAAPGVCKSCDTWRETGKSAGGTRHSCVIGCGKTHCTTH